MSIDRLVERKGRPHAEVLFQVHQLLMNAHPGIQNVTKWGLSCYECKKIIAYLDVQKGKPLMGLNYGVHLEEVKELLDFTGRTLIGHFSLLDLDDERYAQLLTIIDVAVSYDLTRK